MKVDRDDVQTLDATMDWTYCSPYMGTLSPLDKHKLFETGLFKSDSQNYKIEKTNESIPVNRLGRENTIVKYNEINLYEDELCDNGLTHSYFRFRIMNDCFFGLLRSYLRIDHVEVRLMDTRIFHSFGDNYILREFTVKENTYDELTKKGFKFTSEWSLSPQQGDMVSQYVDVVFSERDKIILNN
jgi:type 2A phosphatase activator TIP41